MTKFKHLYLKKLKCICILRNTDLNLDDGILDDMAIVTEVKANLMVTLITVAWTTVYEAYN